MKRNCDRVMGLVGCILGLEEISNLRTRRSTEPDTLAKEFANFIVNNKNLFKNAKFSKTEIIVEGETSRGFEVS